MFGNKNVINEIKNMIIKMVKYKGQRNNIPVLPGVGLFSIVYAIMYRVKRIKYLSLIYFLTIFFINIAYQGCANPVNPASSFSLTVTDVTCTEAWLNLHVNKVPVDLTINKNGNAVLSFILTTRDTTIYDSTLSPNQSYTYRALLGSTKSNEATVKTMDTTSSNFSWQLYKFGDFNATGMPSMLYGVAVVNDSDVWTVGEIYTGTGDSIKTYNSIKWDGNSWNLKAIPFAGPCSGGVLYPPLKAVCKLSDKNILVSDGGTIITYDGVTATADCKMNSLLSGAIDAILSQNSNSIYVIGSTGTMVYYNSKSWGKIVSGTSMGFFDIYSNNGNSIYVCGGSLQNYDGILLEGNENGFHTIAEGKALGSSAQLFKPYFDGIARTVWVSNTGTVFFAGNWLYRYVAGQITFDKTLPGNYWGGNTSGQYWGFLSQIRGLAENQMVLVGERNTIRYFNGIRWVQLGMPYDSKSNYTWLSVGMTNDLIIVAGYTTNPTNGIIMMLKRN
jgi:hypothetical protein